MSSKDFFDYIAEHYQKDLPFVVYSLPRSFETRAVLQKDTTLYKIDDYSESGFVFAPFDVRKDAILIPYSASRTLNTEEDIFIDENEVQLASFAIQNDEDHHMNLVEKGVKKIGEDVLEKVVLSRKENLELDDEVDPIKIFKQLAFSYNSALTYCWYHPLVGLWLGATPETLLRLDRNKLTTMALAGTQDYLGTLDVSWNQKEKEEQLLVTNYVIGLLEDALDNIEVGEVRTVKAGKLLHLCTDVSGNLKKEDQSLQRLILKLHPTPAVCGLPKIEAMQFILDNEHYNREFYTGFLGELNREVKIGPRAGKRNIENMAYSYNTRSSHLFVNLRCMQLKDNKAVLYVGGGITKDSIPQNEWIETVNKTKTIKNILVS
ncbi:chorismate-binding protein [Flavobacteriaceae sp. LMIT009]